MLRSLLLTACLVLPRPLLADTPRVVTDIGPVESLATMVLGDLGTPERLLAPGASPHTLALRPSQARALSNADLVVWVGQGLTPQLDGQIETLASSARHLPLGEAEGILLLEFRDSGLFEHDHGHDEHDEHDDHDHADHDDHDDHDHGDHDDDHHDDHDDHDHAEAGHDDHGHHGANDPHLWLSPENATTALTLIADALSDLDPENAATYAANAKTGAASIAKAEAEARAALTSVGDRPIAVAHDAYQYFEAHFGLTVTGAISDAEANTPGPARLAELRDGIADDRPACVLIEPGTDARLLETVKASGIPTAIVDQLGADLPSGAGFYPALILGMAEKIADCVGN
ncbi:zinc ABC transporter substrate-binding protein [Mameliella sediminis]|uniref:zinc ABC transporter substrate-binding protein n=1 Tax=Mameliella sediminis TaxID=2836866 RepID=UPI001C451413|nr:zinc ABC transporter substrate-binding protein [Mameliella sediminis]MBV7396618.1 zinc ABC transporter substrate-binding protein [Mameliella sediminis]